MVLLSCKTEIPQLTDRIRYPDVDLSGLNRSEIIEEPSPMRTSPIPSPSAQPFATTITEEAIYVALGKEEKEAEVILTWALRNSGGRKIIILHVHQPAQKILMCNMPLLTLFLLDYYWEVLCLLCFIVKCLIPRT